MAEKELDTQEGVETQEDAKKWTDECTQTFIMELEKYPCLYNTTLKEYHDRNERKTCYEAMTNVLGVSDKSVYSVGSTNIHSTLFL